MATSTAPVLVERAPPIRRLLYPLNAFMHAEASGGIVLIACALVALAWANSPWSAAYTELWATKITIGRELTKQFEEVAQLAAADAPAWLQRGAVPHRAQWRAD